MIWESIQIGVPGMKASGNTTIFAPLAAAWCSKATVLSRQACWSIKTYAACTAATVTVAMACSSRLAEQERFSQRRRTLSPVMQPAAWAGQNVSVTQALPLPADLVTPCLVVDRDVLERNLVAMADRARDQNVALRPHAKTHKCRGDRSPPGGPRRGRIDGGDRG